MGSSRLSGKMMMDICGHPLIFHIVERVQCSTFIHEIVVVTTAFSKDDILAAFLEGNGIAVTVALKTMYWGDSLKLPVNLRLMRLFESRLTIH